jgi:hypothetical protein
MNDIISLSPVNTFFIFSLFVFIWEPRFETIVLNKEHDGERWRPHWQICYSFKLNREIKSNLIHTQLIQEFMYNSRVTQLNINNFRRVNGKPDSWESRQRLASLTFCLLRKRGFPPLVYANNFVSTTQTSWISDYNCSNNITSD